MHDEVARLQRVKIVQRNRILEFHEAAAAARAAKDIVVNQNRELFIGQHEAMTKSALANLKCFFRTAALDQHLRETVSRHFIITEQNGLIAVAMIFSEPFRKQGKIRRETLLRLRSDIHLSARLERRTAEHDLRKLLRGLVDMRRPEGLAFICRLGFIKRFGLRNVFVFFVDQLIKLFERFFGVLTVSISVAARALFIGGLHLAIDPATVRPNNQGIARQMLKEIRVALLLHLRGH
jgi:hypothetical protein